MKVFITLFSVAFLASLATILATAYIIMIYAGIWHGFNPNIPPIGYTDSVYIMGAVTLLGAPLSFARKRS